MEKKCIQRWVAAMLVVFMFAGLAGIDGFAFAEETSFTPNQDLLETMLPSEGNRHWVVETLVEDNRTHNPVAVAYSAQNGSSMAQVALDDFSNMEGSEDAVRYGFFQIVHALYFANEIEASLLSMLKDEEGNLRPEVLALVPELILVDPFVASLCDTPREADYKKLLKSIFTETYTASDGTTQLELEAGDIMLRQLQAASEFTGVLEKSVKKSGDQALWKIYVQDYAMPYGNAAREACSSYIRLLGGGASDNGQLAAEMISHLAETARLGGVVPGEQEKSFTYAESAKEFLDDKGITAVAELVKLEGPLKDANAAFTEYVQLVNIVRQGVSNTAPLKRMAENLPDVLARQDMHLALTEFSEELENAYYHKFYHWQNLKTYLRRNRIVDRSVAKATKEMRNEIKKMVKEATFLCDIADGLNYAKVLFKACDKLVNLSKLCKQAYELWRWETLLEAGLNTYRADVAQYQKAPGEDTARAVLDDLAMLQRVRLFGEKISYDLGAVSMESPLAFYTKWDGDDLTNWKDRYQRYVDIMMAASIAPPLSGLTVNGDETMTITDRGDGVGLIARGSRNFNADLPARLALGVEVLNGGTLQIYTPDETISAGYLDLGSSGSLDLTHGVVLSVNDYTQKGGSLRVLQGSRILCRGRLELGRPSLVAPPDETSAGPVSFVTHDLVMGGPLQCTVTASGDVSGSGELQSLTLDGQWQTLSGTYTAEVLRFTGYSAAVSGSVRVSGAVYGPSTAVRGGRKISLVSGATVEGGHWNGDLTAQEAHLSGVSIAGSLYCTGAVELTGPLSVYGDAEFAQEPAGSGALTFYGDLKVPDGFVFRHKINFCGAAGQTVTGKFTAGEVCFANTGPGVQIQDQITVTGVLENPRGKAGTAVPVYLEGNAYLSGTRFDGSLSAPNGAAIPMGTAIGGSLTLRDGAAISNGTLTVGGSLTLPDGAAISNGSVTVGGRLILPGGGTLDGCTITAGGLSSTGALTLKNGTGLSVRGDAELSGALAVGGGGEGETPSNILVRDDLSVNDLTGSGPLRVKGDVSVSGTTSLGTLILEGPYYRQSIRGSDFTVVDLIIRNTSGQPLALSQTITVTGRYDNPGIRIEGGAIRGGLGAAEGITEDTQIRSGLTLDNPLVVTNAVLTVDGPVSVPGITLVNARLSVNGKLTLTGDASSVDAKSSLSVRGDVIAGSGEIALAGTMDVRGDLSLGSAKLTGGTLALGGDLSGNADIRLESLTLNGLIRQRIGSALRTGDLFMSNSSRGGVLLEGRLSYSGTFDQGGTALFLENNLVKEAAQ